MKRNYTNVIVYIMAVICLALFIAGGAMLTAGLPSAHEHVGEYATATEATCEYAGNSEYWHCAECGKYFADELLTEQITQADTVIAKLPHTEEVVAGTPATCTATGLSDGKRCTVCKNITLEQTIIAKLPHTEETITGTPATCTASGISDGKRCTVCKNITLEQTVTAKLPHTEETITGTPATCTASGISDGKRCTVCENVLIAQQTIDALGHGPELIEETQSTCSVQGNPDYYHCARCEGNFAEEQCTTALTAEQILYPLGDHTYKQCFNDTRHYKTATCGHELEETDGGEHSFTDRICDDCGFYNCGVTYTLNDDGTAYSVTRKENTTLTSKDIKAYAEYDGLPVTEIASSAFFGAKMTSLTLPASVTKIGEKAIAYCNNLETITIDENNPVYESKGNCIIDKVTRTLVAGCKTSVIPADSSVISIGNYAFYDCRNLTEITIPYSVTSIGINAFEYCDNITEIIIPERVTFIGEYAFLSCLGLTQVTVPEKVTSISNGAFGYCYNLEEISLPSGIKSIGEGAFKYCKSLKSITIPDSVTSIDKDAFYGCETLTELHIPASVTSIGARAFTACTALEEITVDENNSRYSAKGNCLIQYGYYVTAGCKNSVIPDDGSIKYINGYAFYKCPITEIIIPEGVKSISGYSFFNCTLLTSLHIPKSVTYISEYAFVLTSGLIEITADPENERYCAVGSCLIDKLDGTLMLGSANSVIPDDGSVTEILPYAFSGTAIERIVIPASVEQTDLPSFNGCTELKELIILGNIEKISKYNFSGCSSLESITFPESLTEIGEYAFQDCTSLTEIIIPNSVYKIGFAAFYNCTALSKVKLPDSLKDIYCVQPFAGCKNITEIDTGNGITKLSQIFLEHFEKLKTVVLGNGITEISLSSYLYNSTELTTVYISGNATRIAKNSFRNCTALSDIYYDGTKEQWLEIAVDGWDYNTGDYTIHFNDGTTMQKGEE